MRRACRACAPAAGPRAGSLSLWAALAPFLAHGLKHVLCTDIERDGALTGPNLELYREARARHPQLAWQASGGVRDAADLAALARLGWRRPSAARPCSKSA